MAYKEIRINFYSGDKETDFSLNREIGQPFTWYMDSLMRGRFKDYSGDEVKGVNIVNLNLSTKEHYKAKFARSGGSLKKEWLVLLNTYQLETDFDMSIFQGNQEKNVSVAIDLFISHAKKSPVPQMKKVITHLQESIGKQSIQSTIEKANDYFDKLYAN